MFYNTHCPAQGLNTIGGPSGFSPMKASGGTYHARHTWLFKEFRLFLLAIFFLFCSFSESLATSIVVLAYKDRVMVAADSKTTDFAQAKENYRTTCKIHIEPGFIFASSGNTSVRDENQVYFDVTMLIKKIAHESKSLRKTVDSFTKSVVQPLAISMNTLKSRYPQQTPSGLVLSNVFVTLQNGQSAIYLRRFFVRFERRGTFIDPKSTDYYPPANRHIKLFMGINKEMTEYDAKHPQWPASDEIEGIKRLLNLEIKAHPDKVGPPIDIYLLGANGGQWIQVKKDCIESHK